MFKFSRFTLFLLLTLTIVFSALPAMSAELAVVFNFKNNVKVETWASVDGSQLSSYTHGEKQFNPGETWTLPINEPNSTQFGGMFSYWLSLEAKDGSIDNECNVDITTDVTENTLTVTGATFRGCTFPAQVTKAIQIEGSTVYVNFDIH